MAIKTIRKGKIPEPPKLEGTCPHCGWMGGCEIGDARAFTDRRDTPQSYTLSCPTCGKPVWMQYQKHPLNTGEGPIKYL